MTDLIVAKFGGTSVADFIAMQRCAEIVDASPSRRLVVLSASHGITNLLEQLATGCSINERQKLLKQIQQIQFSILQALQPNPQVVTTINNILIELEQLAIKAAQQPSIKLNDRIVSQGELMSTCLFTELLRQRQVNVIWFDIRQIMLTSDQFGKTTPDLPVLQQRCHELLAPLLVKHIVVTQGFIGANQHGHTTTLGRGGSDYSAALLGEALQAKKIEIWTDVAGIYSSDPRIVPNAQRINEISFAEAAEMATFGAKILHPATLLPAIRSNITVFVGSSQQPQLDGTKICQTCRNPPAFRSIALRRAQTLLTLHSLNMLHTHGFLAEVFSLLARHQLSVDLITTSEVSIALTLDTLGSTAAHSHNDLITTALVTELSTLCRVEIEENLTLVAIIGNHLTQTKGISGHIFGVLENYTVRMICYGASQHNLCVLVPTKQANSMARLLHQHLFETQHA